MTIQRKTLRSRGIGRLATLWMMILLVGAAFCIWQAAPKQSAMAGSTKADRSPAISYKPIEQVQAGERVWACDPLTGEWQAKEVLQPMVREYSGEIISIRIAGQKIGATGNHPFWVTAGKGLDARPAAGHVSDAEQDAAYASGKGRWVDARHLQPGDLLLMRNGQEATVEEVYARQAEQKVYNLQVADVHTYAVGEAAVLVHNCGVPDPEVQNLSAMRNRDYPLKRNDGTTVKNVGTYTIEFESGNKYHGKGPPERAVASARRVSTQENDKAIGVSYEPAVADREAFKEEARRIAADGGPGLGNYNKIESPGRSYLEQDGDK